MNEKLNTFDLLNILFELIFYILVACFLAVYMFMAFDWIYPNWRLLADTAPGQIMLFILGLLIGKLLTKITNSE